MPNELTIEGVKYVRANRLANRVSCWGMYDCLAFHKFEGENIDEVFNAWLEHCEHPHPKYGATLLCPVILLDGDKELRRVGGMIEWKRRDRYHLWLDPVRADPDIARLLASANDTEGEPK